MHDDGPCSPLAATEIGLSVVVPQRARVFPFLDATDEVQRFPRTAGGGRRRHIQPFVGSAEINVETAVVKADGRSPRASGIVAVVVPAGFVEATVDLADVSPVDHIVGLQHLHSYEVEVGGHHVELLAHADDVGVGEVGIQHGVGVGAVALVAPRGDGVSGLRRERWHTGDGQ